MAEILLFDGADTDAALAAATRGASVVAFSEESAARLRARGVPSTRAIEALGDDPEMTLYRASSDFTRAFGDRARDASGVSLKDALRFRETTLWWWVELYLHYNTRATARVRFLETLARVADSRPGLVALTARGLSRDDTRLAAGFAKERRLGFEALEPPGSADSGGPLVAGLSEAAKLLATAVKGAGGDDPRLVSGGAVFVSHAAFWKKRTAEGGGEEDYEHYLDDLLREAARRKLQTVTLGVGPQSTFRTRTTMEKWRERLSLRRDERFVHVNRFVTPRLAARALRAFLFARGVERRFQSSPALSDAFSHRGVRFADDVSARDLGFMLLHQAPWAARCLLEFDAAFRALAPRVVCLYAESSGLGRAAIAAARRQGVRTLGVQHGILYPNYYSYERGAGEIESGSPLSDLTAVYGRDGMRLLESTFRYPKGRVVATGSPRYDALAAEAARADRLARRRELGWPEHGRVLVLASRYRGIRDTHKAAGPAFTSLLDAVRELGDATLVVKPHPAEPGDAYNEDIAAAGLGPRIRVVTDKTLTRLLPAADLLITVESLSATEALVAGVPVVVLRHPSNLRDVVASGAALGVREGESPLTAIRSLLEDPVARDAWRVARDAYIADVAHGADGGALGRLMSLLADADAGALG